MVNNKKIKKEKNNKIPTLRTKQQRQLEVQTIIHKLSEIQLNNQYEPIKKLYAIMKVYIDQGERILVNIPFPEINKRIEGVLAINQLEEVTIRLKNEKF